MSTPARRTPSRFRPRGRVLGLMVGLSLACWTAAASADAHPFDRIIVFGDSHSDVGNVFLLSQELIPTAPYFEGRFSNGAVWVERLAERLGIDPAGPSRAGGVNFAYGGAQTGPGKSPTACALIGGTRTCVANLGLQIDQFLGSGGQLTDRDLIVVQGGSNNRSPKLAADYLVDHVATLAAAGGEYFLVPNLERLSLTPDAVHGDQQLEMFVENFDAALDAGLEPLNDLGLTIIRTDWLDLHDEMVRSPLSFGFQNIQDPACPDCTVAGPSFEAEGTIVDNPDEYLYWDAVHFTTAGYAHFGNRAYEDVMEAVGGGAQAHTVPEPSSLVLPLVAAFLLACRRASPAESTSRDA